MNPKISIVVPVHNAEETILLTLKSILNQTFKDFEVLVINDGSTDQTSKIVNKFIMKDKRIKYIKQPNQGVSASRNMGIRTSKGNYITFLDADDTFETTFLEKMLYEIYDNRCDVCYCGYNVVMPSNNFTVKTVFKKGDILKDYLLGKIKPSTNCWLIKKSLLIKDNIFFPVGIDWGEDVEFFAKVMATNKEVCFVNEYLTNYRIGFHDDHLSKFKIEKIKKDYNSINRLIKDKKVNSNKEISSALIKYRLPALITYRLLESIDQDIDEKLILHYYKKYKDVINIISLNNGLRSIKLNYSLLKLHYKLLKFKKED